MAFAASTICPVSCSLARLGSSRSAINGAPLPRTLMESADVCRYAGFVWCRAEMVEQRNPEVSNDSRRMLEEYEMARDQRKKQGLLEYDTLKRELSSTTAGVALAVGAYCFVTLSSEAAVSYGIGALTSIGITSNDLQKSIQKTIRGSSRALSSPRLVIPAALFGLWGLTSHFAENSPIHLQVTPLLFGFFAYKAAALVQTYRDNQDLIFNFPEPKGPKDA